MTRNRKTKKSASEKLPAHHVNVIGAESALSFEPGFCGLDQWRAALSRGNPGFPAIYFDIFQQNAVSVLP